MLQGGRCLCWVLDTTPVDGASNDFNKGEIQYFCYPAACVKQVLELENSQALMSMFSLKLFCPPKSRNANVINVQEWFQCCEGANNVCGCCLLFIIHCTSLLLLSHFSHQTSVFEFKPQIQIWSSLTDQLCLEVLCFKKKKKSGVNMCLLSGSTSP